MLRYFFSALLAATLPAAAGAQTIDDNFAKRTPEEALCGPEIVTVGDAWEHVQLEREAIGNLLAKNDLVRFPQKSAALASHLAYMQNHSLMVWGSAHDRLTAAIRRVLGAVPQWNRLALGDQAAALKAQTAQLDADLKEIAAQYPDEALISTNAAALILPPAPLTTRVLLEHPPEIQPGRECVVRFQLKSLLGAPVPPEALLLTHSQKVHALILDPLFEDYHHEHPQPTPTRGGYEFRFTPKTAGPYRLWVDISPTATGREEFPICDLVPMRDPVPRPAKLSAPQLTARADGFACHLSLPREGLKAGELSAARVTIQSPNGEPVRRLQPIMGAFAHLVAFADDYKTVLHIHPLGRMAYPGEFGGPEIDFKLRPIAPGDLRLFVQFSEGDAVHLAKFGVTVEAKEMTKPE